jgi:hypothetical protein
MTEFDEEKDPPPDHVRRLMEDLEQRKVEEARAEAAGTEPPKVGYGRPPKSTQFQRGRSGNPKGRPRKAKRFQSLVEEVFSQKVKITENGQTKKVTVSRLVLTQLSRKAGKGEIQATREVLRLLERIQPIRPEPEVSHEEMAERQAYVEKLSSLLTQGLQEMAARKKQGGARVLPGKAPKRSDCDGDDAGRGS